MTKYIIQKQSYHHPLQKRVTTTKDVEILLILAIFIVAQKDK